MEGFRAKEEVITQSVDEETMKKSNNSKYLTEKIRELDEEYYPGIVKIAALCAFSGAALGGGGGGLFGGPAGAAFGAIVGMSMGAVGGYFAAGYHAVKKHQQGKGE